jgi:pimeloyl-ACP methyl ester carboxylesterase
MKRLVIVATGLDGSPKKWQPLLARLREEEAFIGSDWLIFHHCGFWNLRAFRKYFTHSIATMALDLNAKVEAYCVAAGQPYDEIICIGHSFGGLIVRQAYLVSAGAYPGTAKSTILWTDKVSRFVLLASTNRGFEPNNFLSLAVVNFAAAIGGLPIFKDTVQGAAFITNLRISWIRYMASLKGQEPVMIQLLGTQDGVVKREDSIDLQQFPNGLQLDMPEANHDNLYRPQGEDTVSQEEWEQRYQLLRWAILQCDPQQPAQIPSALQQYVTPAPTTSATTTATVFIVHGIRDGNSGWAGQLEDQINQSAPGKCTVIRSTYGYFSAFNFLFPWLRHQNIRWFQDQYSYHFALNPAAECYFIGHSNGTFILGESLKRVSAMQFKRIYLAGSVLPCEYPWQARFDLAQVETLRNDRSCWDWPVGILCSGLRGLGMKDIGTGGFDGFHFDDDRTEEVYYYPGGHGEPLVKENLSNILAFILDGDRRHPTHLLELTQISAKFQWISRAAPYFAPCLLLIVLGVLWLWGLWIFQSFAWDSLAFWLKLILSVAILYFAYLFAKTG